MAFKGLALATALVTTSLVAGCVSIPQPTGTAVTQYAPESRVIEGFDVNTVTDAPLDIMIVVRLDAAPDEVWSLVGAHDRLNEWFPAISSSYILEDDPSTNRDFEFQFTRQCEFQGDILTEDIPFDNGVNAYAYSINQERTNVMVPMSDHLGIFVVEPDGADGSLLTWRQYWRKGIIGQFAGTLYAGPIHGARHGQSDRTIWRGTGFCDVVLVWRPSHKVRTAEGHCITCGKHQPPHNSNTVRRETVIYYLAELARRTP